MIDLSQFEGKKVIFFVNPAKLDENVERFSKNQADKYLSSMKPSGGYFIDVRRKLGDLEDYIFVICPGYQYEHLVSCLFPERIMIEL